MTEVNRKVYIYIFDNQDGRSAEERLRLAITGYCSEAGLEFEEDLSEIFKVERTERGKPYFPHCPQIRFSISHSGSYWVCAVAGEQVGVDLQEHVRAKEETIEGASARFCKMAHRFFHPKEAQFVELDCYRNFFGIWAARESYVKYTGQGIDASFSEYCVIPEEEEKWPGLQERSEAQSWQAEGVWFWEILYQENYTLCVCTKELRGCRIIDYRYAVPAEKLI